MTSSDHIDRVIETFLGNPFDKDGPFACDIDDPIGDIDVEPTLNELIANRDTTRAKKLVLAIGHQRACERPDDPAWVFDPSEIPPAVVRKLPRSAGDYLRVVMAAGRCYRALTKIHGTSAAMVRVRRDVWAACFGDSLLHALELERVIRDHDVLLLGETGTGKEMFARAIQAATPGDTKGNPAPSAAINAAAMPETLVESELFGHVKGAFTGAADTRIGRLRSAHGGSFFLDEVGDLPSFTQVKLLRVIETNDVYPLGSDDAHKTDLRYIAATHKDLDELVDGGDFRQDLFERLAGNVIRIPPLRERPDDIFEIGMAFVRRYTSTESSHSDTLERIEAWLKSAEARRYAWPGNVRELQNALRNLLLGLPPGLKESPTVPEGSMPAIGSTLPPSIDQCEAALQTVSDWYMQRVLAHTEGNYSQAAKILGIDRSTVRRRTRK